MKKILLFLLLIGVSSQAFSQKSETVLVQIHMRSSDDLTAVNRLGPEIYHITETEIFAGVTAAQFPLLQKAGLSFVILDQQAGGGRYYLAAVRTQQSLSTQNIPGRLLWSDSRSALVKTKEHSLDQREYDEFQFTELKRISFSMRQEIFSGLSTALTPLDSIIQRTITAVSSDSIRATVQRLQNFQTRFLFASNRDSVAWWIQKEFLRRGIADVVLDSFFVSRLWNGLPYAVWQKNVVATIPGTKNPSMVIVTGGHHDSYSSGNPIVTAPGADDNASGTAAILELARVIRQTGYIPEVTIKFVTFAAEELGLYGSYDFVARAVSTGMNMKLMINHDMISNSAPSAGMGVAINYYSGFLPQAQTARDLTARFTSLSAGIGNLNSSGSDSYPFWTYGFPAVYFEERDFSPYYHTPSDVIGNTNSIFCAEVVKGSLATLIHADRVPSAPGNLVLADRGDGSHLLAAWTPSAETDVVSFNVRVGTASGVYFRSISTSALSISIENLSEGITYFIGVSAVDADGNESATVEMSQTPRIIPRAPAQLISEALWHGVQLRWPRNMEIDLKGYTIYRSAALGEEGIRLNGTVSCDTLYVDGSVQNGVYYYYTVKALDSTNRESSGSPTVRSRAVSLDQGLCIVDETKDADGSPMNPTDAQVDNFYQGLLPDFRPENYDVAVEGGVTLADLGAYAAIVWHGNDLSDLTPLTQAKTEIAKYLDFGGKILFTTYKPSNAFAGNTNATASFGPGSFLYDRCRIEKAENSTLTWFSGAQPKTTGYPVILVDTTKTLSSSNYHLTGIESISGGPGATEVFSYMSRYDSTTIFGKLRGKPVGVEYLGPSSKVVTLSFPLYYMNEIQAKTLVNHVLHDRFGIPVSTEVQSHEIPQEFSLAQNFPNPFNPTTVMSYQLPVMTLATLVVYDLLGREVAILLNEVKPAGIHQVMWDASRLPSGVYFYQLKAGGYREVKKAVVVK